MPTIQQLPPAVSVDPADEVPVSQAGATHAVSIGTLLSGLQPAILAPTGALLGRLSFGPGGPEPVAIGTGIGIEGGSLVANGADHAAFPIEANPSSSDQLVVTGGGASKLLPLAALQSWLLNGPTIGATNFSNLPVATSIASTDLVAINQSGTNAAISYANLLDGLTIDQASPANPASDSDAFWTSQGGSTMLRQTFAALWNWLATKLSTYKLPVVELSTSTTLDGTVHNGRILVCSQPVTLSPAFINMGSGFFCEILNLSSGNITFANGITTSTGQATLPPGQMAILRTATYSGGSLVFAAILSGSTANAAPSSPPGQVANLASGSATSNSIALTWSTPSTGGSPTSYTVQYRVSGTGTWTTVSAPSGSTGATVVGLSPTTSYDFAVAAINSSGSGPISTTVTAVTVAVQAAAPGQVVNLSATTATTTSVSLSWSPAASGGVPSSYMVQYAVSGSSSWSTFATGLTGTATSVTNLVAGTTYLFQVTAMNAAGSGPVSASLSASTVSAGNAVTSIVWNLAPASHYSVGSGAIGINVHVNPTNAAVQVGLSSSGATPPNSWITASYVNSDLWGAYIAVPSVAGTYYVWAAGTDGSALTVYPTSFTVS